MDLGPCIMAVDNMVSKAAQVVSLTDVSRRTLVSPTQPASAGVLQHGLIDLLHAIFKALVGAAKTHPSDGTPNHVLAQLLQAVKIISAGKPPPGRQLHVR